MDELVNEIHALRQSIAEFRSGAGDTRDQVDGMAKGMRELEEKLKQLESLRLASTSDSPGEAFAGDDAKHC